MIRRHPFRLAASLVLVVLLVAGCGDDGGGGDGGGGDGGDALVDSGTLTVCSDTPYEPFEFQEGGRHTGYDIDLLRAIAENNDLDLQVRDLPFEGILGAVNARDCDVVGSALTITEEREEQVDFSDPYFNADQSLLIRASDEGTVKSLDDLAGKSIGVQSGTTGEQYAEENKPEGATIRSYEDSDGLFLAITAKDIDAVLQDFPVNAFRATNDEELVVTQSFPTGEQYGFAVAEGNDEVLDMINDGLEELRDSGQFAEIFERYFGTEPPE